MDHQRLFTKPAIVGSMISMSVIGALIATYGPAWTGLSNRFDLNDAQGGLPLAVQSVAAFLGVIICPWLCRKVGNRIPVLGSLILIIIATVLIAVATTWELVLFAATIAGFGVGAIDLLISQLLIVGTGADGAKLVN